MTPSTRQTDELPEGVHMATTQAAETDELGHAVGDAPQPGHPGGRAAPKLIAAAIAAVVLTVGPYVVGDVYVRTVAIQMFIYIALAVSYQLIFGYARLASFGHVAFFGIGAYTSGALIKKGFPHPLAWLVALALTFVIALVAAAVVIRLESLLLAITTLALAVIVVEVVSALKITGGQNGLILPPWTVGGIPAATFKYWFVAVGMILIVAVTVWLVHSPFGRMLSAVGDDQVAARALGINASRVLVFVFVLGSVLAGVAGILLVQSTVVLATESIDIGVAIIVLAMVAVGGLRSVTGAVIGAILLTLLPQIFASIQDAQALVYGGILLLVFLVSPGGIIGLRSVAANVMRRVRT
ncbi:MAG: branched-chain amino acid ABC transporter permease [Mycobacteriales bacterium]